MTTSTAPTAFSSTVTRCRRPCRSPLPTSLRRIGTSLCLLYSCRKYQMLTPEEVRGRGWTDPHKTNGLMSASMPMKVGVPFRSSFLVLKYLTVGTRISDFFETHRALRRRRAATAASTTRAAGARGILASLTATARRSLALRYYYKTTRFASAKVLAFASTKVRILTVILEYIAFGRALARVPRRYQVYLLYQYQSTDTDSAACRRRIPRDVRQWLEWGC